MSSWNLSSELNRSVRCLAHLIVMMTVIGCHRSHPIEPLSGEHIELTAKHEGRVIHLADDGNVYREIGDGRKWEYFATVFDPEEVSRSYVSDDGKTYRVVPDSDQRFEVIRNLDESFEEYPTGEQGLPKLGDVRRSPWGSFTLQSPQAPSVGEYVRLRKDLIEGRAKFGDCRVEVTTEKSHSGKQALKCVAPAKAAGMITCKASLSSPLVYFRDGDDFSYQAWYWAEGNLPLTLIDLESELVKEHAGIRLRVYDDGTLGAELKAVNKPQYKQLKTKHVFPKNQWVHVRFDLHLSASAESGTIAIWQDEQLVLSCEGQTLPFRSAIYNSLEIGISAYSQDRGQCVLYVDDLTVADCKASLSRRALAPVKSAP